MQKLIYLDYMATTPVDPQVIAKMMTCLGYDGCFGNSASTHRFGWEAEALITKARQQVAALINADPREIIWTSGATEANNLALKGAATFYQRQGKHIITLRTEHKSVLDTCAYLESEGFEITYLTPPDSGLLSIAQLQEAIRLDTIIVSIMHVNNETGVVQNIAELAAAVKEKGIIFHCDAVQSAGKITLDMAQLPVDLLSISSHKLYGPKGIGALYVRRTPRVRLTAQIHGGGHEQGMRSGTLATHQIVGMGEACALAQQKLLLDQAHCRQLTQELWRRLSQLPRIQLNGDQVQRTDNCLNISFDAIDNETLLASLPEIAMSGGSACNAASHEPSHVLLGMGLSRKRAEQALRLSVGRFTTLEDVEVAADKIINQINKLREISPLWNSE